MSEIEKAVAYSSEWSLSEEGFGLMVCFGLTCIDGLITF